MNTKKGTSAAKAEAMLYIGANDLTSQMMRLIPKAKDDVERLRQIAYIITQALVEYRGTHIKTEEEYEAHKLLLGGVVIGMYQYYILRMNDRDDKATHLEILKMLKSSFGGCLRGMLETIEKTGPMGLNLPGEAEGWLRAVLDI